MGRQLNYGMAGGSWLLLLHEAGWRDAKCANPLRKPRYGASMENLGMLGQLQP